MISNEYLPDRSYFAAANGYSGFRSLFGEIFDSHTLKRVFVLKGGPGTGKSTLLKKLLAYAKKSGYSVDAIYCSSDPHSLDGIIICSDKGRIALLDGTAPHERDAQIPGATDELINLGEGFDIPALASKREEITALMSKKKSCYSTAYSHLQAAGAIKNDIRVYFTNNGYYNEAEMQAERLCALCTEIRSDSKKRIYSSSFGAGGYRKLPYLPPQKKRLITVASDIASLDIIMTLLYQHLDALGAIEELHLSPFSDDVPERIITPDTVFEASTDTHSQAVRTNSAEADKTLSRLLDIHDELIELSRSEFARAASYHFELENIYGKAIDFSYNDAVFLRISKSIDSILGT